MTEFESIHDKPNEIKILISLLDDPDDRVYSSVRDQLFLHGSQALPMLEEAWEKVTDETARHRIETILQGIQKESLFSEMDTWVATGGTDLLRGALLLSKFHYFGLDEKDSIQRAGKLTQDLWLEMNPQLTPLEKVKVLNHVFFEVHGFTPVLNPLPPLGELLIHEVLQKKRGHPLTLGVLYLMMAQSMHLPLLGVNIAGHFAAAWLNRPSTNPSEVIPAQSVDFYINAPIKGTVFTHLDIQSFLEKQSVQPKPAYFLPIQNIATLKLLADKMMQAYERANDTDRIEQFRIFLTAFD